MNDATTHLLEPDDLLLMPDGYEVVDGEPVEKKMGAKADWIGTALIGLLQPFCRANTLGLVFGADTGYVCFPADPKQMRKPDVSFVAAGRLAGGTPPDGYVKLAPDLAVEVISPNETYEEVQVKIGDYKSAKVKLIWVISPKTKTALIRRADGTCAEIGEAGELSGEDVVPGFACKLAELFV